MAEIRPFRATRYVAEKAGPIAQLVTAPYDVISPRMQEEFYARHPQNAIRLELGRESPTDSPSDNRYTRSAATFTRWLSEGVLRADPNPSIYVYDETFRVGGETRTRRGIFAAVRLEDWNAGIVLPHEHTLPKPKADRLNLMRACRASFSPIFALYDDPVGRIPATVADAVEQKQPAADFALAEESVPAAASRHRLWVLDDPAIVKAITSAFATKQIFIADGHHRYETALEYRAEARAAGQPVGGAADYTLMLLSEMGDPGLAVLPTHRLVRGLADLDRSRLLERLAEVFDVDEIDVAALEANPGEIEGLLAAASARAAGRHAYLVAGLAANRAHVLRLRAVDAVQALLPRSRSVAWRGLDVAVLHYVVFDALLGIGEDELASEQFVTYTRDAAAALRAVRGGEQQLAFFLNPTRVTQIRDVALAGDRMPQKSTYFFPKPVTGLVIYAHDFAF